MSSNVYTLTCIDCSKDLLKIGVRDGDYTAKLKAICPCGGESFSKTINGRFSISPDLEFYVDECIMPSPTITDDEEIGKEIGLTIFKMRYKDAK